MTVSSPTRTTHPQPEVAPDSETPPHHSHPPPETHPSQLQALDRWFDRALPRVYGYFITRVGAMSPSRRI